MRPDFPEPYLVPECASYSDRLQALRRQGDLANLVQMAEVLKCLLMMIGISPLANGCVKILPRLCENTGYSVTVSLWKIRRLPYPYRLPARQTAPKK